MEKYNCNWCRKIIYVEGAYCEECVTMVKQVWNIRVLKHSGGSKK